MRNCGTLSTETEERPKSEDFRELDHWASDYWRHRDTHRHQYPNIDKDSKLIFIMDILSTSEYW